jgi:hypothetical protein
MLTRKTTTTTTTTFKDGSSYSSIAYGRIWLRRDKTGKKKESAKIYSAAERAMGQQNEGGNSAAAGFRRRRRKRKHCCGVGWEPHPMLLPNRHPNQAVLLLLLVHVVLVQLLLVGAALGDDGADGDRMLKGEDVICSWH